MDPWELILHHTYSGTPGVAFDHSPAHGGHGVLAGGLDATDFVLDGYANGSGAVWFRHHAMITVDPSYGWDALGGFAAEVVFRYVDGDHEGHLFNGGPRSVSAYLSDTGIEFGFGVTWQAPGSFLGGQRFGVEFAHVGVDPREWTTAAVVHDGYGTVTVRLNGLDVATWTDTPLQPVQPITRMTVGNEPGGTLASPAWIDEIKFWRPNPTIIKTDFTDRVVTSGVTDCWVEWGKAVRSALDDLFRHDVECASRLARLIDDMLTDVVSFALTRSPETRRAWEQASTEYGRLWRAGDVADIGPVLASLRDALAGHGLDVERSPAVQALVNDGCFRRLVDAVPPLDCDPEFVAMLRGGGR